MAARAASFSPGAPPPACVDLAAVEPLHVATWIEMQTRELAAPSVKQRLAAVRHLFDWLVTGQVMPVNAGRVGARAVAYRARRARRRCWSRPRRAPCSTASTPRHHAGLRDRALIGLMVYSFARIGAALGMKVEDVFTQNRRLWVRLREKGGKAHAMPCHHSLEAYLTAYMEQTGIMADDEGAVVPHHRARHRPVDRNPPAPGQRPRHDPPTRGGGRHRDEARQPQLPGDRDHRLSEERRHAGEGRQHGEPRQHAHDAAL